MTMNLLDPADPAPAPAPAATPPDAPPAAPAPGPASEPDGGFCVPGADASPEEIARFHRALGVPETPEGYALVVPETLGGADPDIDRRLHAAGFTPAQAQLVYDLAAEILPPLMEAAAQEFEAERQTERLAREFGGEARFREVAGQLLAWGRANLQPEVLRALSSTHEGVMALHRMMASGEPGPLGAGGPAAAGDEDAVRTLMRDPRYWRDRDPGIVAQVTEAFRRLYGGD